MKDKVFNKFQQFRQKSGITQEELAKAVGVTRQTIISIEKGSYAPSIVLGLKISKYFKQPLEKVFNIFKESLEQLSILRSFSFL